MAKRIGQFVYKPNADNNTFNPTAVTNFSPAAAHIGIQCPPSTKFIINEKFNFTMNLTGVFELQNEGYNVESIRFLTTDVPILIDYVTI